MGFDRVGRQCFYINGKAVVHRDYFHLIGSKIHYRMICTVVALVHFHSFSANSETEHLVAEANSEDRDALFKQSGYRWNRIFASFSGITRAVRQEHAIRLEGQNICGACGAWHDGYLAAFVCEQP